MSDVYFYVGGYTSDDKNFWMIKDDGSGLTVVNSLKVPGTIVRCIAVDVSDNIYIGGSAGKVYKYNSNFELDTSWATNGVYTVGSVNVRGLSVDLDRKLAVVYDNTGGQNTTLLDSNGAEIWSVEVRGSTRHGYSVRFLDETYLLVGIKSLINGDILASRIKISDGSEVNRYTISPQDGFVGGLSYDSENGKVYFARTRNEYSYTGSVFKYPENGIFEPNYDWYHWDLGGMRDILYHTNGYVYTGGQTSGGKPSLLKLDDSDGSTVATYSTGQIIYCVKEDDDGNIVVGGNQYLDFEGENYDIAVLDTDLVFLRGIQLNSDIYAVYAKDILGTPPSIVDQSGDVQVPLGQQTTLIVTAVGSPVPTYQWYKNDQIIPGETSSFLSFYVAETATYRCRVSNDLETVWSSPIVVTATANFYNYSLFNLQLDASRN